MQCLKCGRELAEHQAFCDVCLAEMEQYPVNPETHVHLPHVEEPAAFKKQSRRKRSPTAEEQAVSLKRQVRKLRRLLALAILLLFLFGALLVRQYTLLRSTDQIGRNYVVETTTEP